MMKINYEEFNELQKQQKIRDYAQDVYNCLICLEQLVKRKDKKQIRDMMSCIHSIENEAVENISKMIGGDQQTMTVYIDLEYKNIIDRIVLKNVHDIYTSDDEIEFRYYDNSTEKELCIETSKIISRQIIKKYEVVDLNN